MDVLSPGAALNPNTPEICWKWWSNASKRRTVSDTSSLPVLQYRMYMFIKSAIAELSEATVVRSWEITGVLRNEPDAQETCPICCKTVCEDCILPNWASLFMAHVNFFLQCPSLMINNERPSRSAPDFHQVCRFVELICRVSGLC
jgi:hypothetical protein